MPVLGTILKNPSAFDFHGLQDLAESAKQTTHRFKLILFITKLHSFILFRQNDDSAPPIPKRLENSMRCRVYLQGTGVLTCFPFVYVVLRVHLGSTYSQLMNIAEKPWPFRRKRFSRFFAVTCGRIFISTRST